MPPAFALTGVHLTLTYVESEQFIFSVNGETGLVTLSTRALEIIWASSYLNGIYYYTVGKKGGLSKSVAIDPSEEPEVLSAMKLFDWALNASLGKDVPKDWPDDLRQPSADVSRDSWENLADELTLVGVGYVLLHEAAHVFLKHDPSTPSGWSIDQEKDADRQAVEWYFQDTAPGSNERTKRGLGVATVLLARVASAMFTGKFGGQSHPISWQRLDQMIRLMESDGVHPVFAYLAHLLPLYRSMSGKTFAPGAFDDFLHAFDSFIDDLSRTFPLTCPGPLCASHAGRAAGKPPRV